ncbi:unnamed protein product [Rotaria magnacalcarata]|uniref:Uncharacterized protein n=1 Tax=Rotaria magnacalcarata TaxID=392030 RepID=A0A814R1J5_9BILA|nr:unnamed protein product [Rotaria magnacalcarata]CAF1628491.1 unnamed protein product [Rotaria magnacalcarata]CAF1962382.1 unnamed protein product [Rotaria magnacalcarata]CAF2058337.1 unnamed protein product [Rotaria magnacalcarata]CAF2266604.1 unnamed protein product [Rotaria magnacalcarata]
MAGTPSGTSTRMIVWLDAAVFNSDNKIVQGKISAKNSEFWPFTDDDECARFIRRSSNNSIVLIVSGGLGVKFVPRIEDFEHVVEIYVYCGDVVSHEKWAKNYTKIKLVTNELNTLLAKF